MFGKEYAAHLDILTQSFGQMNNHYQEKIKKAQKSNGFIETFKKIYVLIFGIPEIGFQIRSMYFKKIITSYVSNKSPKNILDAGSGIGAYSIWLAKRFHAAKIIGGEIDKDKLYSSEIIIKQLDLKNVSFVYFDIMKTHRGTQYDLIICIDVLEHIYRYKVVLKNFYYLLKRDGYLYIHVPQPNQKRIFKSLNAWQHDDHKHEGISIKEISNELKKLGFKIIVVNETFGFFGKLAWELNHITLSKNIIVTAVVFPFLYLLLFLEISERNKNGLGVSILVQKQ